MDDISIFAPPSAFRQKVKDALKSEFDCKDLSDVRYILGLEVNYTDQGFELSQCRYIEKVLLKYGMIDCHPVSIPLDPNTPLRKAEPGIEVDNINEYQSMIGSLMYAVIGTRPDLAHTITVLSQFSSAPNEIHLQAAKHTLRYLKGTMDWKLVYPKNSTMDLTCFSDSSYGSSLDDRRSYSGYVIRLGNAAVSWCSQKQRSVAVTTTEAEYMALSLTSRQLVWIKRGLDQLRQTAHYSVTSKQGTGVDYYLLGDNQGSLELTKNPRINSRSKHIDIHYHCVREQLEAGDFSIVYIPTADNLADILTKYLPKPRHHALAESIRCNKRGEVL